MCLESFAHSVVDYLMEQIRSLYSFGVDARRSYLDELGRVFVTQLVQGDIGAVDAKRSDEMLEWIPCALAFSHLWAYYARSEHLALSLICSAYS